MLSSIVNILQISSGGELPLTFLDERYFSPPVMVHHHQQLSSFFSSPSPSSSSFLSPSPSPSSSFLSPSPSPSSSSSSECCAHGSGHREPPQLFVRLLRSPLDMQTLDMHAPTLSQFLDILDILNISGSLSSARFQQLVFISLKDGGQPSLKTLYLFFIWTKATQKCQRFRNY